MSSCLLQQIDKINNGKYDLYHFCGKLIFDASAGAIFNDELVRDDGIFYDAFTLFDKGLPIAAAGIHSNIMPGLSKARKLLSSTIYSARNNISEMIKLRWCYFECMYSNSIFHTPINNICVYM